ncbi:putative PGG domain-containing protein [Helianthus annuus]|uniref:PGG domain-containing protein n=1 Tax=Helianthus annuus TaxID=4232 RepID=A0A9K3NGT7_HELAN|nr:putative PGG domain-containing protein [Helianthus annuus]
MANHCMVINCLITAMVFAAAYTFPGGYRQTEDKYNGFPVFLSKPSFLVFVLADVVSFLLSCASIAIFSSINTSRFAELDFLQTLPKKMMFGLGTLVLSMMMLTIALLTHVAAKSHFFGTAASYSLFPAEKQNLPNF